MGRVIVSIFILFCGAYDPTSGVNVIKTIGTRHEASRDVIPVHNGHMKLPGHLSARLIELLNEKQRNG